MATTTKRAPRGAAESGLGPLVGYVRVSTEEQAGSGLGLAAQRATIHQACELRSLALGEIYSDTGSGRTMDGRAGLSEALSAVSEGAASGLVVAKLDRLSRSLLDFAQLMERSRSEGWSLIALDLGVDTSTPQGELMASVLATFSQFERRLIGQRTKDALVELKAQGVTLGRPRTMPDEAIDLASRLRSEGKTLQAIADRLNADGISTGTGHGRWYAKSVSRALQSSTQNRRSVSTSTADDVPHATCQRD